MQLHAAGFDNAKLCENSYLHLLQMLLQLA